MSGKLVYQIVVVLLPVFVAALMLFDRHVRPLPAGTGEAAICCFVAAALAAFFWLP